MTINVYIVDDSATARAALRLILENSDEINVLGVASTPLIALKRMQKAWPDVIISDLEMPEMTGIEFLRYLQRNRPTPFIVFSNYTGSSADSSIEALALGAVDIITKPDFSSDNINETRDHILSAVKAAARAAVKGRRTRNFAAISTTTLANDENSTDFQEHQKRTRVMPAIDMPSLPDISRTHFNLMAIGSSTGGTTVIEKILRMQSKDQPGIVIVQHMPENFTKAFASRVNNFCSILVKEAEDGDVIRPGVALIAPGGKHMRVASLRGELTVQIFDGDMVNRHKPSVDVLFNSVAEFVGDTAVGVILTGMGKDGAKGLLNMRRRGALTLAQDEKDCAVYGMPKAAVAIEAVDYEVSSDVIAALLQSMHAIPHD